MLSHKVPAEALDDGQERLSLTYGRRFGTASLPRYELADEGVPAEVAYQAIRDELNLDGNPALNLATFVTTWMEPEAERLMTDSLDKNYIDQDEYPQTTAIQDRCVNILARLFHAPDESHSIGTATVGSSEAIHLAGLAMKWGWRARRGDQAARPNLVMGANVQVCWEKFARYFEVEPRYVPLTDERYVIGVDQAMAMVDADTIGVVGILGSTYTGEFEPIAALDEALVALNDRTGWDVPIHVDGASGAFVAPFTHPDLRWDFRLPSVRSINVSGHKYGLVYPGVGWVVWREAADLPEDLVFHVNYLGGDQPTFNLNFSKSASQVIAQYYNFLRLGRAGYTDVMSGLQETAGWLAEAVVATGHFELLGGTDGLPLVCFRLTGRRPYTVFDVSERLRERGWIVPAYTLAPDADHIAVLRVVVREGLSLDMASLLVEDMRRAIDHLDDSPPSGSSRAQVHPSKTKGVC